MKLDSRRGQAALEFLMTYGWAILVILIVLVVLWQWGLFNPSGTIKPGQSGFWGVVPNDYEYDGGAGTFRVILQNNIDNEVEIKRINVSTSISSSSINPAEKVSAGNLSAEHSIAGLDSYSPGSSFEVFVVIAYNDSRVNRILLSSGRIWGSVS
ncbi:MAG: hypothetical protein B6U72_06260 [Candidatus Altiarchaeales archaeon ex4484_2]|nr:MAG: hypothetical protein B6U72_06260 [Candidatus Altiarchaeales archaeon ex4484_2]